MEGFGLAMLRVQYRKLVALAWKGRTPGEDVASDDQQFDTYLPSCCARRFVATTRIKSTAFGNILDPQIEIMAGGSV